jgi:hypothetical protein
VSGFSSPEVEKSRNVFVKQTIAATTRAWEVETARRDATSHITTKLRTIESTTAV